MFSFLHLYNLHDMYVPAVFDAHTCTCKDVFVYWQYSFHLTLFMQGWRSYNRLDCKLQRPHNLHVLLYLDSAIQEFNSYQPKWSFKFGFATGRIKSFTFFTVRPNASHTCTCMSQRCICSMVRLSFEKLHFHHITESRLEISRLRAPLASRFSWNGSRFPAVYRNREPLSKIAPGRIKTAPGLIFNIWTGSHFWSISGSQFRSSYFKACTE